MTLSSNEFLLISLSCCRRLRDYLEKCGGTAMNSKLIASHKKFFSKMVVDAVMALDEDLDLDLIGVKKVPGGAMDVSFVLVVVVVVVIVLVVLLMILLSSFVRSFVRLFVCLLC
jgi:chaperonin GroEL (HSP60 family)